MIRDSLFIYSLKRIEFRIFRLFRIPNSEFRHSGFSNLPDDTFTMFENKDTANGFLQYLNSRHNSIKFTIEFEQDNEIPFLDILVIRCPPRKYKINLIRTLTYRCYRICSFASLLQSALGDLRKLLLQNGYPQGIITYNVNDVLNRNRNKPRSPVSTVPNKGINILLPYLL